MVRMRQFAAHALHLLHRGMQVRSIQKADADFAQALGGAFRRKLDVDAEGFDHVGRAALRADAAIAMLGDADACSSGHERGRSGDVEGATGVAAGAAGVDQRILARNFFDKGVTASSADGECVGCTGTSMGKGAAAARIASAKPTISSTVSPFMRKATSRAAICASVHWPVRTSDITSRASRAIERLAVVRDAMEGVEDHARRIVRHLALEERILKIETAFHHKGHRGHGGFRTMFSIPECVHKKLRARWDCPSAGNQRKLGFDGRHAVQTLQKVIAPVIGEGGSCDRFVQQVAVVPSTNSRLISAMLIACGFFETGTEGVAGSIKCLLLHGKVKAAAATPKKALENVIFAETSPPVLTGYAGLTNHDHRRRFEVDRQREAHVPRGLRS